MQFAGYMAYFFLCKQHKSGEKNLLQFRRYRIFLGDCFYWRTLYIEISDIALFNSDCKSKMVFNVVGHYCRQITENCALHC